MTLLAFVLAALLFLVTPHVVHTAVTDGPRILAEPPRHSTGLTDAVQWDNYTLWIEGQRVFLHSGEFHTFRLPVPDLWLDIFQKMVAAGLNGVRCALTASIYIHWALTNPAPGVLDFNDWRDLQPVFKAAEQAGIFIVLRPGPYINAETTAGGLALWTTSLTTSELRTNATDIEESWMPYVQRIINESKPNQVSDGGSLIAVQVDNEYSQSPIQRAEYFAQLEATYTSNGIVVPLTYNDPGEGLNFINGTGAVDIYGLDSYPQGFDCSNPTRWSPVVTNYHSYHEEADPGTVWYMPEFQGGSFDPWGGPGYDACEVLTGPDFQDVFYKQNWASNVKMISYYMLYGGTNWGGIAAPVVYTSYDYGSTLRENRALSPKFDELKRQGLFLRSSPEFRKTDWIGDSSTGVSVTSTNNASFVTLLRNPDTGAQFVIVRQADSTSTSNIAFNLTLSTSAGTLTIPRTLSSGIQLDGRQSKVVLADYTFGSPAHSNKLLYSTAAVLFAGSIGGIDTVFLYGDTNQGHEFAFSSGSSQPTTVAFAPGFKTGLQVVSSPKSTASPLVLWADTQTASTFFAPAVSTGAATFTNYWQFGTNETVLVGGPMLVRNATVSGSRLALRGDLNASTPLTLLVPSSVSTVSWNGANVAVKSLSGAPTLPGAKLLEGQLSFSLGKGSVSVPALTGWKFKDSLPEVQSGFDDANWTVADHTTTNITTKPLFGDGRVLYECDYGFCENVVLWRGHFNGIGSETSVNLTINGGNAFGASVFLNDVFLGTTNGSASVEQTNALYSFPDGAVKTGTDNVITVVQDHMGNDEDPNERSPRGIPGFQLNSGNFTTWKVQGKLGGYTNYPDKVRGILNEGGLFGEREGWHLPGFDTSSWASRSLSSGLPNDTAGVGFFVTTFNLAVPQGVDAMFSFVFDNNTAVPAGQAYRALLFVNGWQYGKRVANIGPQAKFPVPSGILDHSGKNTVAIALWALENAAVSPTLELVLDEAVEGGVGQVAVNNPAWTPRE
ncbi:glycoside hydrolase family 35 protein [Phanerochaete carnosa HHB-10118-sp]|uniref:beta-galactosidase n=1 Tax=Phanerochaete carnosa (strain HHB-10118-sp) TaxID=650164 RepID=K5VXC5_PHACS|nr:glycoside hydrolase family 35 protein [Phanerochaete carnosa HHB-10118-sp]EKM56228.1 glycoside hydrolase family 35 protein [Phanerochaete carnosa HHB-10118-sp]